MGAKKIKNQDGLFIAHKAATGKLFLRLANLFDQIKN
jgi:hypothetical protein